MVGEPVLSVCHVVPNINVQSGGPAVSVPGLVDSLAEAGLESTLMTLNYAGHGRQTPIERAALFSLPAGPLTRVARGFNPLFSKTLERVAGGSSNLIHNHGLWMFPNTYARRLAERHQLPLVISPRGMLEEWSLQRSRFRKWVVWKLMENRNLETAKGFHVTSAEELESVRKLGFRQPAAVIPNGVEPTKKNADRANLERAFPQLKGRRWCLFLGRLHPKKGIDTLLHAWKAAGMESDWHLVIAGPDLVGYRAGLEQSIDGLQVRSQVSLVGMLDKDLKDSALAGADVVVLPSHSENFGIAVAEAMLAGVPAIATKGTPWKLLSDTGAGWWIDFGVDPLSATLQQVSAASRERLEIMGETGRQFALNHFDWGVVAAQMIHFYRYLLGNGRKPNCVDE